MIYEITVCLKTFLLGEEMPELFLTPDGNTWILCTNLHWDIERKTYIAVGKSWDPLLDEKAA